MHCLEVIVQRNAEEVERRFDEALASDQPGTYAKAKAIAAANPDLHLMPETVKV